MPTITENEWNLISTVEQYWHTNKSFPSIKILSELTGYSVQEVDVLLGKEGVQKRITARGIDYDASPVGEVSKNKTKLSDVQLSAALSILNIADGRSLAIKLKELGIPQATYNGWVKSKAFSDFMKARAEELYGEALPLANKALMDKVVRGDMQAIKLYFEMTGRWTGQQAVENQNFKLLVYKLIEIIQKYINDPVLLAAIAEDMKMLAPQTFGVSNGSNTEVKSITSNGH